jgi:tripartite-type tricarboxylate transporter receptor subunit TctC
VPGYLGGGWSGIGAPAHTPVEIIDLLNREINAKGRLENLGSPVLMMSPAEFRKLIADETERWAKVIKFAKIKPECGAAPRSFYAFNFLNPTGSSTFSAR